eukprot:scaffold89802_cov54-Phaeocystis_antarctica.AAC.1
MLPRPRHRRRCRAGWRGLAHKEGVHSVQCAVGSAGCSERCSEEGTPVGRSPPRRSRPRASRGQTGGQAAAPAPPPAARAPAARGAAGRPA